MIVNVNIFQPETLQVRARDILPKLNLPKVKDNLPIFFSANCPFEFAEYLAFSNNNVFGRRKCFFFQHIFFDGAHLTGKLFDDAFYEKTKEEVKEKLTHTVGDYYKEEVKKDLNMRITMDELKQAIKKMKTNKGVDPYGVHPKLLKKFKFNTISMCLHLINNAFFMGIWPFDKTIVKFLNKSGKTDYSNPSSWRPISLTSHLGKVVERVIDRRLRSSDILDIDEQQFGFQPGKSTLHYLYKLYHDILVMKNLPIATVYDLEKAFDSV